MEATHREDTVNIDEITMKSLEYYMNLVDITATESERIDFNFEAVLV